MNDLIGIYEGSIIMGVSIDAARKYKMLGFVIPVKRTGRKDFYQREDFEKLSKFLPSRSRSLSEIKSMLDNGEDPPTVCPHCKRA